MSERETILKWEVLLDDAEWNRTESLHDLLDAGLVTRPSRLQSRSYILWVTAGILLLVVSVAGLRLWGIANVGLNRIDGEIRATIDAETWSWETGNPAVAGSLVDDEADPRWLARFRRELVHSGALTGASQQTEIKNISLRSGLAMVEVIVEGPDGARHSEMRFFRKNPKGDWLRSSPSSIFWGSKQMLETANFRIYFRQRDAHAVEGAAARLDSIYADLRQDAGLPPTREKLIVEVKPLTPYQLRSPEFEEDRLVVPSPWLIQVAENRSDEEILIRSIVHPLVAQMLTETQQQVAIRWEWRPMLRGLHLWQAYVGTESVASWYRNTVAILYGDTRRIRSSKRPATLEDLQRLCREYYIWRYALDIDLVANPWLCTDLYWASNLPIMAARPMQLSELLDRAEWDETPTWPWSEGWRQSVAAATVIDHLVDTYGREQLPALIASFRMYDTWDELIPAVLGISAQEFERGWLAHVKDQNRVDDKGEISVQD